MSSIAQSPLAAQVAQRSQLSTVVALRFFAVFSQLVLLGIAHAILGVALPWPMLGLIFFLMLVLNVTSWVRLRQQHAVGQYEVVAQLFADMVAFSLVLYFTGGVTNPFVSLYLPLLGLAAALLSLRQVLLLALFSVLAYSLLMVEYIPLVLANPADGVYFHLVGMWLNFLVSAAILVGFVARLSNSLRVREAALSFSQERLSREERLAALGNQAASIAHQLGTPVSTIATVLADLKDDPALRANHPDFHLLGTQLESIQATLGALRQQIQDAEVGAEQQPLVNLGAWLEQAMAHWRNRHPGQELVLKPGSINEPELIDFPQSILDLAFNALLENAMQSHIRQGVQQPIHIGCDLTEEGVHLRFEDCGGGIAPTLLQKLGQQVVQGHGQGMGLFLLSNLLQREGARIVFENTATGAGVVLVLPKQGKA